MLKRAASILSIMRSRPEAALLAAFFALACINAVASLWLPFGWDHGMMASTGDTLAQGGLPYRDSWEVKGPLAFVPFAVAQILFGNVMWGVRLAELVILIPALVFFARSTGAHTGPAVGVSAGVGVYLWVVSEGWFFTAQPDIWAMALTTVAVCLVLPRQPETAAKAGRMFLVGALIGCAGLIKPVYLAFGLAPLAFLALAPGLRLERRVTLAAFLAAGAAVPIALTLAAFAAAGGLDAFIEVQFAFNLGTYRGLGWTARTLILRLGEYLAASPAVILAPIALAGVWSRRADLSFTIPLLAWLLAGVIALVAQSRLNTHHWFSIFPAYLMCVALGLHAVTQLALGGSLGKLVGSGAALVFGLLVAAPPAREIVRWAREVTGALPENYYSIYQLHSYNAGDEVAAAQHIRERTSESDSVFVWGIDATVRYLAGRPNPTRFVYDMPLTAAGPLRAPYRAEMMRALNAAPPAYIVVGAPWAGGPKENSLADFPEFGDFIASAYVLETSIGNLNLYRRAAAQ